MSYQPPFDGNWFTGPHQGWMAQYDKPPSSVQTAVKLIYAGAAIQVLSVILNVAAVRGRIQSVLATTSTPLTASQRNIAEIAAMSFLVVGGIVGVSLWLWMASRNNAGRRWARILSTVFFAFLCLGLLAVLAQPVAMEGKIFTIGQWVVGLVAIVLLWQGESSKFFTARSQRY